MIRLQDLVPAIYYDKSRDFQFIGRLYDIVLNHIKTNADLLYDLPNGKNKDKRLLNLLALTLGFQTKHTYNSKQLEAICSVLPLIMKNKGSLMAIVIATNALLHAEGLTQALDYKVIPNKSIILYLPAELSDLTLLTDLMDYILPAGIYCEVIKELKSTYTIETTITTRDTVIYKTDTTGKAWNKLLNKDELMNIGRANTIDTEGGRGILLNMEIERPKEPTNGD